jgi:hypothetical protein
VLFGKFSPAVCYNLLPLNPLKGTWQKYFRSHPVYKIKPVQIGRNFSKSYLAKADFASYSPLAKANGDELLFCYSKFAIENLDSESPISFLILIAVCFS